MEWKDILKDEVEKEYFKKIMFFLDEEYKNKIVFPKRKDIFKAFELTKFDDIKVVILGQDPYHNENEANGLSFSVNENIKLPPSLKNIFKEIKDEYKEEPLNGNLEYLAKQGVFLLNSTLTVRKNEPNSHKNKGWQKFTDFVISEIANKKNYIVFMLWGNFAKLKKEKIEKNQTHLILETTHPSPLSAHKGFFGCNHFKLCNNFLQSHQKDVINWIQ